MKRNENDLFWCPLLSKHGCFEKRAGKSRQEMRGLPKGRVSLKIIVVQRLTIDTFSLNNLPKKAYLDGPLLESFMIRRYIFQEKNGILLKKVKKPKTKVPSIVRSRNLLHRVEARTTIIPPPRILSKVFQKFGHSATLGIFFRLLYIAISIMGQRKSKETRGRLNKLEHVVELHCGSHLPEDKAEVKRIKADRVRTMILLKSSSTSCFDSNCCWSLNVTNDT